MATPGPLLIARICGHTDASRYTRDGQKIRDRVAEWAGTLPEAPRILDWGCGPGRVTQFWPDSAHVVGIDTDQEMISWAKNHLRAKNLTFETCSRVPPTKLVANSFDLIYGISIITHLSATTIKAWAPELVRILAPRGRVVLSFHGTSFHSRFLSRRDLVRQSEHHGHVGKSEGSASFGSFHTAQALEALLPGLVIHRHIERADICGGQDVLVLGTDPLTEVADLPKLATPALTPFAETHAAPEWAVVGHSLVEVRRRIDGPRRAQGEALVDIVVVVDSEDDRQQAARLTRELAVSETVPHRVIVADARGRDRDAAREAAVALGRAPIVTFLKPSASLAEDQVWRALGAA